MEKPTKHNKPTKSYTNHNDDDDNKLSPLQKKGPRGGVFEQSGGSYGVELKKQKHLKYQNFFRHQTFIYFSTNSLYWYIIQWVKLMLLMKVFFLYCLYFKSQTGCEWCASWTLFFILNDHFFTGEKIRVATLSNFWKFIFWWI